MTPGSTRWISSLNGDEYWRSGKYGILVGAKNGAGKTHVLRALYLAVVRESGVADLMSNELIVAVD